MSHLHKTHLEEIIVIPRPQTTLLACLMFVKSDFEFLT